MKKLTENSKQFHDLIYYIWQLLTYYADIFGYNAPESAHKMRVKLFRSGTLTKIRVSVEQIMEFSSTYSVEEMRLIMNEYLELLLQDSPFPPFTAGKNVHEIVEPLYITILVNAQGYFDMDFLWVDNLDAYRIVKQNETANLFEII